MKTYCSIIICLFIGLTAQAQLQSPDQFLPHKLGEHFTPHHILVDYYEHVAEESPLVKLVPYGKTNQDRPLLLAIVTSEPNQKQPQTTNPYLPNSPPTNKNTKPAKKLFSTW